MSTSDNSFNNNDSDQDEYESDFENIDPDLIEDVVIADCEVISTKTKSLSNASLKGIVDPLAKPDHLIALAPELDPANDPKTMIKYQGCLIGAIINFAIAAAFGYLIFKQFGVVGDLGQSDQLVLGSIFKIRYALVFVYFLVSLLHKPYVHEFRNSEAPIIAYSILEIYYNLYDPAEARMYGLLGAVALPLVCCIRRKKFMNFFNPWNKDKTDIKKFIAAAKRLFTELNDL